MTRTIELPTPSGLATAILTLGRRDSLQADDVADIITSDPASAARLLRFVNSPLTGRAGSLASIRDAVMFVGPKAAQLLALSFTPPSPDLRTQCPRVRPARILG